MSISGVILAAGQGTRMKSSLPKVLHNVLGIPMIDYAQEAISHFDSKYVVVGHQSEKVSSTIFETFIPVVQKEQLGTGHAISTLLQSSEFESDNSQYIVVIPGDVPLIRKDELDKLVKDVIENKKVTFIMVTLNDFLICRNSPGGIRTCDQSINSRSLYR